MHEFKCSDSIVEELLFSIREHREFLTIHLLKTFPLLLEQNLNKSESKIVHLASYHNLHEVMDFLIDQNIDLHATDKYGENAIFYTSNKEMIKKLKRTGLSLEHVNSFGKTALLNACSANDKHAVKALVQLGADVNFQSKDGHNVIHYIKEGPLDLKFHFFMMHLKKFNEKNQKELKKIRLKRLFERSSL